jgi:hypothetical protein
MPLLPGGFAAPAAGDPAAAKQGLLARLQLAPACMAQAVLMLHALCCHVCQCWCQSGANKAMAWLLQQ